MLFGWFTRKGAHHVQLGRIEGGGGGEGGRGGERRGAGGWGVVVILLMHRSWSSHPQCLLSAALTCLNTDQCYSDCNRLSVELVGHLH